MVTVLDDQNDSLFVCRKFCVLEMREVIQQTGISHMGDSASLKQRAGAGAFPFDPFCPRKACRRAADGEAL